MSALFCAKSGTSRSVSSGANAMFMGKHGCLSVLSKLLDGVAKKNYIVLKYIYYIHHDFENITICNTGVIFTQVMCRGSYSFA